MLICNKFSGDTDAVSWGAHFENHSSRATPKGFFNLDLS